MYTGYTHGDKLVTMYLKTITIYKNPPIGKNRYTCYNKRIFLQKGIRNETYLIRLPWQHLPFHDGGVRMKELVRRAGLQDQIMVASAACHRDELGSDTHPAPRRSCGKRASRSHRTGPPDYTAGLRDV